MPITYFVGPYPLKDFEKARQLAAKYGSSHISKHDEHNKPIGIYSMALGKWLETEEELATAAEGMTDHWSPLHTQEAS